MEPQAYADHYVEVFNTYVNEVLKSKRVVGRLERLANERWQDIYQKEYYFNQAEFEKKLKFCSLLNIKNKLGKVSQIQLAPWQLLTLAHLCVYHPTTPNKVIDTVSLSFSGKNGKSSLAVVISLIMIIMEDRINANIPIICPTQRQANQVLDYCKQIIQQSPAIKPFFKVLHSTVMYKGKNTNSKIIICSNDPEKVNGLFVDAAIIDEWFLFNKSEAEVLDILKSKSDIAVNPLVVVIGTFSSKEHHNYESYYLPSLQILEGNVRSDNHFILYCAQDSENEIDAEDKTVWAKSNPSLGIVKDLAVLVKKYNEVQIYPSRKKTFETETLNFWKEVSQENPWLSTEVVNDAMRDNHDVPTGNNKTYLGLDLSSNVDLASVAILTEVNGVFYSKTINIMPSNERNYIKGQNELNLERLFVPSYDEFKARNFMAYDDGRCVVRCQTPVLDESLVEDCLLSLCKTYNVYGIFYDRYKSHQLVNRLEGKGIYCQSIQQTMTALSEPLKYWEKKMIMREFKISKNICTKWQFGNVDLYELNGLIKLNKNQRRQSIDAIISLNIAVAGYMIDNESSLGAVLANYTRET